MPQKPFEVKNLAPYIELLINQKRQQQQDLYAKQLRDLQMRQMIMQMNQAQQPQPTYGDIFGQVTQPTGMDWMPNMGGGIGGGIPTPIPQMGQRLPTEQEVNQRLSGLPLKTTGLSTMLSEKERRFKESKTIGGFSEDALRKSYISYKAGRTRQDPMALLMADMARKAGNLTQAQNILTPPPDMDFNQYVEYITGENKTLQPTSQPTSNRIKVKNKATGQTGTILESDFDTNKYIRIK
jgi:hypothetical protein